MKQIGWEFQRTNIHPVVGTSSLTRDPSLAAVILKNRSQISWKIIKDKYKGKWGELWMQYPLRMIEQ